MVPRKRSLFMTTPGLEAAAHRATCKARACGCTRELGCRACPPPRPRPRLLRPLEALRWSSKGDPMTPVSVLRTLPAVFLASLSMGSPAALAAQDRGSLSGIVRDVLDGTPVRGAEVAILGTHLKAKTSASGAFDFSSAPVGLLNVRVELGGYISLVEQVALAAAEPGTMEVRLLPIAVVLQEFFVNGRRGSSTGYSITEVDVKLDAYRTAADVLAANFPGLQMNGNRGVGTGTSVRIRGTGTLTQSAAPAIYLDGVPILDHVTPNTPNGVSALSVLSQISANEVASIRVLRGPSTAVQYPDASNGVILIETLRGGGKRP
ncbi:MAG: hypothetical protein EXR95_07250 [Gemmatimonadetes bacterium]|nr:hypothetical protein [Gemmatimonadota bacterium]